MFFKKKWIYILIVLIFGLMLSCAGENEVIEKIKKIEMGQGKSSLNGGECLKDSADVFSKMLESELAEDKLAEYWICVEDALMMFSKYVRGKSQGQYTDEELRSYFENNFLKGQAISDDLLSGVMGLKRIFIGGSSNTITSDEILVARDLIRFVAGLTYEALPYMKIYFQGVGSKDKVRYVSEEKIEKSIEVLKKITKKISSWLNKSSQNYSFVELASFLKAIDDGLPEKNSGGDNEDHQTAISAFLEFVPLIQSVKVILVGENKEKILAHQWGQFFEILHGSMDIFIRFNYFIKDETNWVTPKTFRHVNKIVNISFDLIEKGIWVHPNHETPHEEFSEVFKDLGEHVAFPLDLTPDTIQKIWEALVDYGLKPLDQDKPTTTSGLNVLNFTELKYEYEIWYETQLYLNSKLGINTENENRSGVNFLAPYLKNKSIKELAHEQVDRIVIGDIPLVRDGQGRIYLNNNDEDLNYDFDSYFTLNWQRAIIRILIRGFSENEESRINAISLKRSELTKGVADLKELLIALGVANPNDDAATTAKNIHQLATIFMPHAEGTGSITLAEGTEYVSLIFSGIEAGGPLFEESLENCLINKAKRIVSVKCYREIFRNKFNEFVSHMPNFVIYFESLSDKNKDKLQRAIEDATRENGYSDVDITQSEINKGFILLHYVEIYLMKYDANKNEVIKWDEAEVGYPVFRNVLAELVDTVKGLDFTEPLSETQWYSLNLPETQINYIMNKQLLSLEDIPRCLYSWMLRYGRAPYEKEMKRKFGIKWCYLEWGWKKIKASRITLMQVLAALATRED
jgi:hypothetical protein